MSRLRTRGHRDVWLLGIVGVVLAGLLIAVVVGRSGSAEESVAASSAAAPSSRVSFGPLGDLSRRDRDDPRALGAVDAPVVMVAFSDFRCPFCAEYFRTVEPELISRYVDTGKLRIEWRDQPVFGEQSELAARAGWAAAEQGRFWEFVTAVYGDAEGTGHPDLPIDVLVAKAQAAGVADLDRFRRETTSGTYDAAIADDRAPTVKFGIIGVPAFVINGEPIIGTHDVGVYAGVIDGRLAGS